MSEVDSDRDPEVDAAWRAQSRDEPPAALDDAIRAAAHRAVHAQPASTTARARSAWPVWAGFAAAASIGAIAIGVWQLQPRDVDETKVVASDVPRASPAAPRPQAARRDAASTAGKMAASDASAIGKALDDAQRRVLTAPGLPPEEVDRKALAAAAPHPADERQPATESVAQNAPAAAAPAAAPSMQARAADAASKPSPFPAASAPRAGALPASRGEAAADGTEANALAAQRAEKSLAAASPNAPAAPRAQRAEEPSAAAPAAARVARSAAPEKPASAKTSGDYITAIRRARAEHREADARAELAAMRAEFQFADAALPPDLSEWAKGVPRAAR
jgi:hypothetical protein